MEDIKKKNIDFNLDIAQTQTLESMDKIFELVDLVSSVNISCGFHAGCPLSMKKAIEYCKFKNKVIGAHIGFPANFDMSHAESKEMIESLVLYQLGAISAFAKANSLNIEHVRPHGDMYRLAAQNLEFSENIASSIKKFSKWLIYFGAAGEILEEAGKNAGINVAHEVHLNKVYKSSSSIDFDQKNIEETGLELMRLRRLLNLSEIDIFDGTYSKINYDTVHFSCEAKNISELLNEAGKLITPKPVSYNKAALSGWVE